MNSATPLVSIIMPAYNAELYISKAIRSVQEQTFRDWELIVVDDGSVDDTALTAEAFAVEDSRIRVSRNGRNLGVAKSRNKGLALCQGSYVAFLDSDDVWKEKKLELQLSCIQKTGADLVYTSYAIVDGKGRKQCSDFTVPERTSFSNLLKENVIGCSTVLLTAEAVKNVGFEENVFHEDFVLWLDLLRSGRRAVGLRQVLVDYYLHPNSKAGNKHNSARKRWDIYRQYLGLSLGKSAWYFAHYAIAGARKYAKL